MKKLLAVIALAVASVCAHASGTYVLVTVKTYNPFSPSGTSVISGIVPTAGMAVVDGSGNVSATGITHSFNNVSSSYNYTNGVWTAMVGGTSVTHAETCTETAGFQCTSLLSGFSQPFWNNTEQNGGAASNTCSASVAFGAGNCDRVSIVEIPGVSLTIIEQSEFGIPGLPWGFIYNFIHQPLCADFAAQLNSNSLNNAIPTASRCTGFASAVTVSITAPPANGTANLNGANIVYTPNLGFIGSDTLGYQGTDGTDTDTGVLTITVVDATPDAFSFTDRTDVTLSTVLTSNAVTVSGIAVPVPIAVTGGLYSINGGPFTAVAGNVSNGNTVAVRQTSSASFSTTTNATATIGGVSDTYAVTTLSATGNLDTDLDDIADAVDKCTLVANTNQLDADGDGYGNLCDADLNNSGAVTAADFGLLRSVLGLASTASALAAAADMNGSGAVTTSDFGLLRARLGSVPGPSGLHPNCPPTCP